MALVETPQVTPALLTKVTSSVLSLLVETDHKLKALALERLEPLVDNSWPEIADSLPSLEALYEDTSFSRRELAAYVISKVYYHLEEYSEAMHFALRSGSIFDPSQSSEYVRTVTSKLVDSYIKAKKDGEMIDKRHEAIIESLLSSCVSRGEYRIGLGIALESNRLDWVKKFIIDSGNLSGMLGYLLKNIQSFIPIRTHRSKVLELLLEVYAHTPADKSRDWPGLAQCYFLLGDAASVADLFKSLIQFADDPHWGWLMAYQVAFDLSDIEDQRLCKEIMASPTFASLEEPSDILDNIKSILAGKVQTRLTMEFLYRNNKTDLLILETLKTGADNRSAVVHNGVVLAHALMQAGTASDAFLRNNLEWLARAVQWAKFAATASLGVVHRGHVNESRSILSTYLPGGAGERRSPFSEGGALFALGLVHANHADQESKQYLQTQLEASAEDEVLQVGAALGLGMTCLATRDAQVLEQLKATLYADNAVAGEAAGFSIGLVMAGSGDAAITEDLLKYAHETQHEKIVRACSVALALVSFRQEQAADVLVTRMTSDSDAVIRYGGMFVLGMAYCATAQNDAIRQLLHFSVSDASDDVRRAAVISLAFVLAGEPHQLPKVLKLLAESYNPHVRYAVCLAIGIACSGKAATLPEAFDLIEPLTKDPVEFVRQGAYIGLGLLCQETSDKQVDGKVLKLREAMLKLSGDRHEDSLVRFGAELGLGLMDISGRNAVTSFFSKSGRVRVAAAAGFCLFSQVWFWYPFALTVSLATSPTACIALNERLKMPRQFAAKTKAGQAAQFAYPEPTKPVEKTSQAKVASAVLSANKGRRSIVQTPMPTASAPGRNREDALSIAATAGSRSVVGDAASSTGEVVIAEEPLKRKGENLVLFNPFRIVPAQERGVEFFKPGDIQPVKGGKAGERSATRYVPLIAQRRSGWIILEDLRPNEAEDLLDFEEQHAPVVAPPAQQPAEVAPPEEFEWTEQ